MVSEVGVGVFGTGLTVGSATGNDDGVATTRLGAADSGTEAGTLKGALVAGK